MLLERDLTVITCQFLIHKPQIPTALCVACQTCFKRHNRVSAAFTNTKQNSSKWNYKNKDFSVRYNVGK